VRRCVWSTNLVNEEALAYWGLSRQTTNQPTNETNKQTRSECQNTVWVSNFRSASRWLSTDKSERNTSDIWMCAFRVGRQHWLVRCGWWFWKSKASGIPWDITDRQVPQEYLYAVLRTGIIFASFRFRSPCRSFFFNFFYLSFHSVDILLCFAFPKFWLHIVTHEHKICAQVLQARYQTLVVMNNVAGEMNIFLICINYSQTHTAWLDLANSKLDCCRLLIPTEFTTCLCRVTFFCALLWSWFYLNGFWWSFSLTITFSDTDHPRARTASAWWHVVSSVAVSRTICEVFQGEDLLTLSVLRSKSLCNDLFPLVKPWCLKLYRTRNQSCFVLTALEASHKLNLLRIWMKTSQSAWIHIVILICTSAQLFYYTR